MSCSLMEAQEGSVCVGKRGQESGDPICLFCPPDVFGSRLKDLAWQGGGPGGT